MRSEVGRRCTSFESPEIDDWLWNICFCIFFIIWIACTPGALCYQHFRMLIAPKCARKAARPRLIIQHFSSVFVTSSPTLDLILWQESRTSLPPSNPKLKTEPKISLNKIMAMSHCCRWHDDMQQYRKTKARTFEKGNQQATNMWARRGAKERTSLQRSVWVQHMTEEKREAAWFKANGEKHLSKRSI